MSNIDELVNNAADPESAAIRFEELSKHPEFVDAFNQKSESARLDLINLISFSGFLYRYISRHPNSVAGIGPAFSEGNLTKPPISNVDDLLIFKYQHLLNITWMDFSNQFKYEQILFALTRLAEHIFCQVAQYVLPDSHYQIINNHLTTFGMGKLGASELNLSSDIDLIFVCSNTSDVQMEIYHYQKVLQDSIRLITNQLEKITSEGFLYRVDLKLRPWGRSGPLVMTINETENYYEASSEIWERFAWLRARAIMGPESQAVELKNRLKSFIYRRSLDADDLIRFRKIKNDMCSARTRKGYWNVKVGEGGIRDIEFFIQMLQMVNAYQYPDLQDTGTLNVLNGLKKSGLIDKKEAAELTHSYLFLRKLENRLQMKEEQQTHELPDEYAKRLIIARSMGIEGESDNEVIDTFESQLFTNQMMAKSYFERILPE